MRRHYCAYFDHRYVVRGLAMIRSLRRFEPEALIWVLCLSDTCYDWLSRLAEPGVRLIRISELERADPALARCKSTRSLIEYYFTCTPALVGHVLGLSGRDDIVTYVDSDLFFFSDPKPLFDALGNGAVSIIPHRFPDHLKHLEHFGIFNVGWLSVRHDERGLDAVNWWRARCIEWCFDIMEGERFADQKYLDRFPHLFEGVVVLDHPGANLAPWNLARHTMGMVAGRPMVDGEPLIFFHFQGVKQVNRHVYLARHYPYRAPFNFFVRKHVYRPYVDVLSKNGIEIQGFGGRALPKLKRNKSVKRNFRQRFTSMLKSLAQDLASCLHGQVVFVVGSRVI